MSKKYLFFDTECANCFGGKGKICEFGYVLTDENFRILKKEEITINPGRGKEYRFNLGDRKGQRNIALSHGYEDYFSSPPFYRHYDKIAGLLTDKDTVLVGFAIGNDIEHLDYTCKRYRLPPIPYAVYDVQIIVKHFAKEDGIEGMGLGTVMKQLAGFSEYVRFTEHLSSDDSHMTMVVLLKMMEKHGMSFDELVQSVPECKLDSLEYMEKSHQRKKEKKVAEGSIREWHSLCDENKGKEGIHYIVSARLQRDPEKLHKVIESMKGKGYIPCAGITISDIFVVFDVEEREKILGKLKDPYEGKMVAFEELMGEGERMKKADES